MSGAPVAQGLEPVWVPLPTLTNPFGSRPSDFEAAAGWSVVDLDWYAESAWAPRATLVGAGRVSAEALQEAHGGTAEGPWRTTDGEDLEADLHGDRTIDPLGRPVTMVVEGDVLGVSLRGDDLEALTGEGTSLADEPQLVTLADLADAEGCYAIFMALDGGVGQLLCQLPDLDGGAAVLLVSTGGDDPDAAAEVVRDALAGGQSVQGQPYEELATDVEVAVEDGLVLVRLRIAEGRPADLGYDLLATRDPLMPAG